MTNIKKIAQLAGVSPSTVSRVLNQHPYVKEDKRARVQAVIEQLDYVPNINAINLKRGETKQIGIVVSSITSVVLPFINSFIDISREHGYQNIIFTSNNDPVQELSAFESLKMKKLDGIMIISCINPIHVIEQYCKYGPIVSWQRIEHEKIASVYLDQYVGYSLALEHLIQRGYTKIANAFGRANSLNTKRRKQAYEETMKKYQLPIIEEFCFSSIYDISHGEALVKQLHTAVEKPDAILCANDNVAAGIFAEAKKQKWNIPKDFAIVGFDNQEISRLLNITTVHNPIKEQGENAFHILAKHLLEEENPLLSLEFQLVQRGTT